MKPKIIIGYLRGSQNEHYNGFINDNTIDELDREGKEIALMIKSELSKVKLEYFYDARMENEMI